MRALGLAGSVAVVAGCGEKKVGAKTVGGGGGGE